MYGVVPRKVFAHKLAAGVHVVEVERPSLLIPAPEKARRATVLTDWTDPQSLQVTRLRHLTRKAPVLVVGIDNGLLHRHQVGAVGPALPRNLPSISHVLASVGLSPSQAVAIRQP
jgi:hypothetical protein